MHSSTRIAGFLAAVALIAATAVPIAWAKASRGNATPGDYTWEAGPHTFDDAVSFKVKKSNGGKGRKIVGLVYRNKCLSNNEAKPPSISVKADGSFSRSWKAATFDKQQVSFSGTFNKKGRARGTLDIKDLECHSTAHFKARKT